MTDKLSNKDWLTARVKRLNKTKVDLANLLGMHKQHLNRLLLKIKLTPEQFRALALYLECDEQKLFDFWSNKISETSLFTKNEVTVKRIPVIGFVQAGLWKEAIEWQPDQMYYIYAPEFEEYKGIKICSLEVRGDSMNLIYPEGTCIIYVNIYDYQNINGNIPSGKNVICQRKNPKNELIEATVKEYVSRENGIYLVPHSNNLEFIACRLDTGDCGETEIIGVVIGSFRKE